MPGTPEVAVGIFSPPLISHPQLLITDRKLVFSGSMDVQIIGIVVKLSRRQTFELEDVS